jgi:flagellar assembly protein FliH
MTLAMLRYDSFDASTPEPGPAADPVPALDEAAREAERLAAYESGYRSGWDDCLAAEQEAMRKVGAELARNLGDLGFTYHEARAQLMAETEALLEACFRTLLSQAAGPAVARRLADDVGELAATALDLPVASSRLDDVSSHAHGGTGAGGGPGLPAFRPHRAGL